MGNKLSCMKISNIISVLLLCACVHAVVSCNGVEQDSRIMNIRLSRGDAASKAVIGNNGYYNVKWSEGDEVSVFGATRNCRFVTQESALQAVFSGVAPESDRYYVAYPYSTENEISDGVMRLSVPRQQMAVRDGFADGVNVSAGQFETGMTDCVRMYNVCGYVKFTISSHDISSIVLSSVGGEQIAGEVSVAFSDDGEPLVIQGKSATEIELCPQNGVILPGTYYIAAKPGLLIQGIRLLMKRKSDGFVSVYEKSGLFEIVRSAIYNLGQIDASASWRPAMSKVLDISLHTDEESGASWGLVPRWPAFSVDNTSEYTFTLKNEGLPISFQAGTGLGDYSSNGGLRLFGETYITLPAVAGMRLRNVKLELIPTKVLMAEVYAENLAPVFYDRIGPMRNQVDTPVVVELALHASMPGERYVVRLTSSSSDTPHSNNVMRRINLYYTE